MILHLANDYAGSTVYKNLISSLDGIGEQQNVYVPIRSASLKNRNKTELHCIDSSIHYRHILSTYTRINYNHKINRILEDIHKVIDFSQIKLIHAHTWYSDGGVAYELNKKYDIPYIVAVRNTDISLFLKYMLHLRSKGRAILENAEQIIFLLRILNKK